MQLYLRIILCAVLSCAVLSFLEDCYYVCLLLPLKLCYGIMCVIKMRVFLAVWGIEAAFGGYIT